MLSKHRTWILPAFAAIVLLASCNKSNKQGKFIPKDAAVVLHINGESLNSKLPWDEVKKNALFEKIYSDSSLPSFMKPILDNPGNSGIDIKSDLIFFAQKDSTGGIIVFEGTLKDAAKFKTFNLEALKGSLSEKDGISFVSKAPVIAGWNKDKFVYVIDAPQMNRNKKYRDDDIVTTEAVPRDLMVSCKAIFDLKESNSLGTDDKFSSLMKKEGDVHLWLNTEQLYEGMDGMEALRMIKMDKFYTGNIMTATAGFDNGKINLNYKTYAGKDLDAIFKKYSGGQLDETMLKQIPSKDVAAVFALHFKPEGIKELVELSGMEGLINIGLMAFGFTMDDFIKANKGDIMVAVTDIKSMDDSVVLKGMNGKDVTFHNNSVEPHILFAASIGDKDAFNQLIRAGKKMSREEMDSAGMRISYNTNSKYFAIGNSKSDVEKYLGTSNNTADYISHITGNPIGGYVNLQYIMQATKAELTSDSSGKLMYDASIKMWDNIYLKGGDYSDGGLSYDIEINLLDKTTNSLKQLNNYLSVVGPVMDDKRKVRYVEEKVVTDTVAIKKPVLPPNSKSKAKKRK